MAFVMDLVKVLLPEEHPLTPISGAITKPPHYLQAFVQEVIAYQ